MKLPKSWVNKKAPTSPEKQEQHKNRKTKDELIHRWENEDWVQQYQDFLEHEYQQIQE